MTITIEGIKPGSRRGKNDKGRRTYSEVWIATSDVLTNPFAVGTQLGTDEGIVIGSQYAHDSTAYCIDIEPREMSDGGLVGWEIPVSYSDDRRLDPDPTDDEVLVSYSGEVYQIPVFADAVTGKPIVNTAGDYFFDPTITADTADLIAHIRANVTSVPTYAVTLQNTVNQSAITISDNYSSLSVAEGLAKYGIINISDFKHRGLIDFYEVQYDIHLKASGWKATPLNVGFRELDYSGNRVQIKNAGDDLEVTTPVQLDEYGMAIDDPTEDTGFFLGFHKYPIGDLTVLPAVS